MKTFITCCMMFALGCASTPKVKPRAEASPATISVIVEKDAVLAGKIGQRTVSVLRQKLLENNVAVPVTEGATSDLTLKVLITRANFTNATAYDWSLVENAGGRVIAQGNKTPSWGHTEHQIADVVLAELTTIDTRQYASNSQTNLPKKEVASNDTFPKSNTDGTSAWAVIVGVANYRNELPDAPYADSDAEAFAAFAKTTLGVPDEQMKVLTNDRASRSDIAAALFEWLPRNAVSDGPVYVFFSGHGAPDIESGATYLVPYDADPTYVKTGGISVEQVRGELAKLKSERVYLVLDACFTGAGDRSVLAKGTRPLVPIQEMGRSEKVIVLTASMATQATGVKEDKKRGLFTHHMLSGLAGAADLNADRDITLYELVSFTFAAVKKEARLSNREQQPTVSFPDSMDAKKMVIVTGLP